MDEQKTAVRTSLFSIAANTGMALTKWTAGFFGNSYALIADAIESTTDIFASILVLVGLKYSGKPADENHPYGHGRVETLVTFLVVGFLIISATIIAYESLLNISTPHDLPKPFTLYVLALIVIVKELAYRFVLKRSKQTNSSSLKADAWHHRSDSVTSLAAFIGISIALLLGKGFESADDWAALFSSGFIFYNSWLIFRPALGELMDEHLYEDLVKSIRQFSLKVEGVLATEKCFVRKAGLKYHVDLHATVDAKITVKEGHDIAHRLKDILRKELPQLGHVLIHIEPTFE